jgi:hypothetical protein
MAAVLSATWVLTIFAHPVAVARVKLVVPSGPSTYQLIGLGDRLEVALLGGAGEGLLLSVFD